MGKQSTLDSSIYHPRVRYHAKSKRCDWINCKNSCFLGSKHCMNHTIDVTVNFGYGLFEFIIPIQYGINAHDYFKKMRRVQFESDKKLLLIKYPNGKLF